MKNVFVIGGFLAAGLFALGVLLQSSDTDVVSTNGLHWHSKLTIIAAGKEVPIPSGIGISGTEMAIHTHEADGEIHMEFGGTVRKDDLRLGRFFTIWGKDIRSFGANMRMTVNGVSNTEFENYMMHDGDAITLQYD